jgi:hypothetical protein
MTIRVLPLVIATALLGAIVAQNAAASICFDCPDAGLDVDVAEAENTTSTSLTNQSSSGTNLTG